VAARWRGVRGSRLVVVTSASGESEMRTPVGARRIAGDRSADAEMVHRDGSWGSIRVAWLQRTAKAWISYRVLVDGEVVGRVRFGHPATIEVCPGLHEVVVKHWWYETNSVPVEVAAGGRSSLYGGIRIMPQGSSPRQTLRWYRENSMWLADQQTAPAVKERPLASRWHTFRRFMLVTSPVVFFVALLVAATRRDLARAVIALALLASSVLALAQDWRRRRGRTSSRPSSTENLGEST
jgi:hypothetical protein